MSTAGQIGRRPTRDLLAENLGGRDLGELRGVLDEAARLLGKESVPPVDEIGDFDGAIAALEAGWHSVRTAVAEGGQAAERLSATSFESLADRLVNSERAVHEASSRSLVAAVGRVREVTADLERATSVEGLMTAGAQAACRLGFHRSLVSRIDGHRWITERFYLEEDSEWAEEILAAGRQNPANLGQGLPEDDVLRLRTPILVAPVSEQKRLHQAVADACATRSYVAAPIVVGGSAIGFVHADRFFQRSDVDLMDVELIGLFSQAFSFVLERVMLSDELRQLRESVARIGDSLQTIADDADISRPFDLRSLPSAPLSMPKPMRIRVLPDATEDVALTRREAEVINLMAQGATNQRIGRTLVISEGTAKSHVKNILRKLGAANRAEAVSLWHESKTNV